MSFDRQDPRVRQAFELLAEVLRSSSASSLAPSPASSVAESGDHAYQVLLTSATDLLVPWSPEAAAGIPSLPTDGPNLGATGADWNSFFASTGAEAAPGQPAAPSALGKSPIQLPIDALVTQPSAEDELAEEAAEAAVDGLYEFVHALGRRDLETAMNQVAADFHTLEDDVEVDRRTLRQRIESFLEQRQEGELDLHLSRVPEPVAHPLGILLEVTLHADHAVPEQPPQTTVLDAVVLMTEDPDDREWRLATLVTLESRA